MHIIPRRYDGVDETLGIGSAAGDAIGYVGKGVAKGAMAVGAGAASIGLGLAGAVGSGVIKAAPYVAQYTGEAAIGAASFLINGYGPIGSPLKAAVKGTMKIGENMVNVKGSHLQYNRYLGKLERKGPSIGVTKFGAGVLAGFAGIQAVRGAYNAYMGSHMGKIDTQKTSLTPDFSPQEYKVQHPDFAGATGDLVFALSANRHG